MRSSPAHMQHQHVCSSRRLTLQQKKCSCCALAPHNHNHPSAERVRGEIKFPYVYRRVKSKKGRASGRTEYKNNFAPRDVCSNEKSKKRQRRRRWQGFWLRVCAERGETFCSSALTRAREAIINSPFCFKQRCDAFGWSVGFISVATEKELHFVGERETERCCVCWVGLGVCVCV